MIPHKNSNSLEGRCSISCALQLFTIASLFLPLQLTSGLLHTLQNQHVPETVRMEMSSCDSTTSWSKDDVQKAKDQLKVWPLDEYNTKLLNEVHPKSWNNKDRNLEEEEQVFDFVAIGAGAGGLVSSRQAARRGAKSAMISSNLAGGDCLNVGCVPSKALIRCARMIREVQKARDNDEFGINISGDVTVDFGRIMERMRKLRADIAPIDGHVRGENIGVSVYQGFGRFTGPDTIEVLPVGVEENKEISKPMRLRFKKAAISTGGKAKIPQNIPGLDKAPYITNETLFNLTKLPKRMIILGSGVVALEMAQTFATFGTEVTVLVRGQKLFPRGDPDAGPLIRSILENNNGVKFITNAKIASVETLKFADSDNDLPLIKVEVDASNDSSEGQTTTVSRKSMECECLLIAAGRVPNIEKLNLEAANVEYDTGRGIKVDDNSRSLSNPNVFSIGDCTADVPRLTHMSGEMAKVVVQNSLFSDDWKLSSLVVPSCMYTEPEFATVGLVDGKGDVDVYTTSLEDNDRAILDSDREGYVKIFCKKGSGIIIGGSIIGSRAGELINEISLAIKHDVTLEGVGRNIHCYPTTGESIMACGLQLINSKWKRYDE